MTTRDLVILFGLALAAWGHLLLHELSAAVTVWTRMEAPLPPAWRSPPSLAGGTLLVVGALCVLTPVLGGR
jgi:hypothetical protein